MSFINLSYYPRKGVTSSTQQKNVTPVVILGFLCSLLGWRCTSIFEANTSTTVEPFFIDVCANTYIQLII
jgi:hypothetical protein